MAEDRAEKCTMTNDSLVRLNRTAQYSMVRDNRISEDLTELGQSMCDILQENAEATGNIHINMLMVLAELALLFDDTAKLHEKTAHSTEKMLRDRGVTPCVLDLSDSVLMRKGSIISGRGAETQKQDSKISIPNLRLLDPRRLRN